MGGGVKLCECGCGQETPIATRNRYQRGQLRGQPMRYVPGHPLVGGRVYEEVRADVKTCPRCKQTKQRSDFSPRFKSEPDGDLMSYCKPCAAEKTREWYSQNKGKAREKRKRPRVIKGKLDSHLRRWYGITAEQFDEMLKRQEGVCAICRETCASGKRLAVDHDHATGRVRGLLCEKCNHGLGRFRDRPDLLERGAAYLRKGAAQ